MCIIVLLYVVIDTTASDYLGCFIDAAERDLPNRPLADPQMNSHRCLGHCEGFKFAGMQVWDYILLYWPMARPVCNNVVLLCFGR